MNYTFPMHLMGLEIIHICNHYKNKFGTLGMRSPAVEHTVQNAKNDCEVVRGISQRDKYIIDEGNE